SLTLPGTPYLLSHLSPPPPPFPSLCRFRLLFSLFFFNDPATPEIYTLSLHDALPISRAAFRRGNRGAVHRKNIRHDFFERRSRGDRKSTRLNSSHQIISYAVFCLKKKNKKKIERIHRTALK